MQMSYQRKKHPNLKRYCFLRVWDRIRRQTRNFRFDSDDLAEMWLKRQLPFRFKILQVRHVDMVHRHHHQHVKPQKRRFFDDNYNPFF